jgi:hypothetical protein
MGEIVTWSPEPLRREVAAEFRAARHPHIPTPDAEHDAKVTTLIGYLAVALEEAADCGMRRRIVKSRRELR